MRCSDCRRPLYRDEDRGICIPCFNRPWYRVMELLAIGRMFGFGMVRRA